MKDSAVSGTDRAITYDKPWMTIDREPASPHKGSVYLISGILDMDLPSRSWSQTPTSLSRITMLGLDFAVSQDGGRSFGPVRRLADSVFGSDLAVGPTGSLEVVYPKSSGGASAIIHLRSTDGGASFESPATIATGEGGGSVGGPMVASRPNGELLACWSAHGPGPEPDRIRCAVRAPRAGWNGQATLGVAVPAGVTSAFPTIAGTAKGWYLLMHLIGATQTETVLFRSDGRQDFTRIATLATVPGLGQQKWCFARDCRFDRNDLFMAGDYISLSAGRAGSPRVTSCLARAARSWGERRCT